ncbi:MAG: hypothetical protein J0L92_29330 [Deltaproteobacteria bacterium]|nr:hypothetical protein [Deltaproteobacteria bacterium]
MRKKLEVGEPLDFNEHLIAERAGLAAFPALDGEALPPPSRRPKVLVTVDEHVVVPAVCRALGENRGHGLLDWGGTLARVQEQATGGHAITIAGEAEVRTQMVASVELVKRDDDGAEKGIHPPGWLAPAVVQRGEWPGMRRLRGLTETAVLRPDGTVLSDRGFDDATGLYLTADDQMSIPAKPTESDVEAALETIADPVRDFRFGDPHSFSGYVAAGLTLVARPAFLGPSPLFLAHASTFASGKGLLWGVVAIAGTGRIAPAETLATDENELRKDILSKLISGSRVAFYDEIKTVDSAALRSVLTAHEVGGRVLGLSKNFVATNTLTLLAAGNNVPIDLENGRRIIAVRLVTAEEDPSKRTGFKYPDLLAHVASNAAGIRRALLVILANYCAAGRPPQKLEPMGSYEAWSALVRGAIVYAGLPDPAGSGAELRATDEKQPRLRRLAELWLELLEQLGKESCTAKRAIEYACGEPPGPLPALRELLTDIACDKTGHVSAKVLGHVLRSVHQRVFDTPAGTVRMLDVGTDRTATKLWRAELMDAGMKGSAGMGSPYVRARAETGGNSSSRVAEKHPCTSRIPALESDPFEPHEDGSGGGES